MIDWITQPFQYAFMQRAMIAAISVGILCAVLGVFVVLRRMSLIGHALTHSALPGMVIAYILGAPVLLGAMVATLLTSYGIGVFAKNEKVYEDTSIGMIPTVMFALGVLLISITKSYRDISSMLFGNILGVSAGDLLWTCVAVVVIVGITALFMKELKLFTVDPQYSKAIGLPVKWIHFGLLIALAITIVVGIQAVGTILTNALLVIPVAAARLMTHRLKTMMISACVIAVVCAIVGVYASYYLAVSSGAAIVLSCAFCFAIAWGIRYVKDRR